MEKVIRSLPGVKKKKKLGGNLCFSKGHSLEIDTCGIIEMATQFGSIVPGSLFHSRDLVNKQNS